MKNRIRPGALLVRERPAGLPQRVVQHSPPTRRVEKSHTHRLLDERRHAGSFSRTDICADRLYLIVLVIVILIVAMPKTILRHDARQQTRLVRFSGPKKFLIPVAAPSGRHYAYRLQEPGLVQTPAGRLSVRPER